MNEILSAMQEVIYDIETAENESIRQKHEETLRLLEQELDCLTEKS